MDIGTWRNNDYNWFYSQTTGTAAAALVGGATVAGYLNAKFHIQKDISGLFTLKRAERQYANAGMFIYYSYNYESYTD